MRLTREVPATAHPVRFGIFPEPVATDLAAIRRLVTVADREGVDYVGVQDHPYQARYLDTVVLLADLAARTEQISFFTDVANLPLRGAPVLAKQAATLDLASGGRFELGLGAGAMWEAVAAFGGHKLSPPEAIEALEEAIEVIRALWTTEHPLRVGGEHHRLDGAHGGPEPAHPMGVWVGGYGPQMVRTIGRLADGWIPSLPFLPPEEVPARRARLDEAAEAAGRSPADVRGIYNVGGWIGGSAAEPREDAIVGPVSHWVDTLTRFATELAMDTFVLWLADSPEDQLRRFAGDVAPAVRERLR